MFIEPLRQYLKYSIYDHYSIDRINSQSDEINREMLEWIDKNAVTWTRCNICELTDKEHSINIHCEWFSAKLCLINYRKWIQSKIDYTISLQRIIFSYLVYRGNITSVHFFLNQQCVSNYIQFYYCFKICPWKVQKKWNVKSFTRKSFVSLVFANIFDWIPYFFNYLKVWSNNTFCLKWFISSAYICF